MYITHIVHVDVITAISLYRQNFWAVLLTHVTGLHRIKVISKQRFDPIPVFNLEKSKSIPQCTKMTIFSLEFKI